MLGGGEAAEPDVMQRGRVFRPALVVALAALAAFGTGCLGELRRALDKSTPREHYEQSLEESGLAGSALARAWRAAALRARDSAPPLTAPFLESGYFPPERPEARGYRIPLRRGQRLTATFSLRGALAARIFADLYEVPAPGDAPERLVSADSGESFLEHEARRDGAVILLLQPELLSGGRYELRVDLGPTLSFPVHGADPDDIRSRFGAERDAGRRSHEGVDIFAPRGTPVLAAAGGLATWVGDNELGGKVVMVRDRDRNEGHYYAHLDSQLVSEGTIVERGDTLGLVGNTGNARTTPPHLHFGIYARGEGAVDPAPYLVDPDTTPGPVAVDSALIGGWLRTGTRGAPLLPSPGAQDGPAVPAGTVLRAVAGNGVWYRVELPDGAAGYVHRSRVSAAVPLGSVPPGTPILERPDSIAAVVDTVRGTARPERLGRFLAFDLVRLADGRAGWVRR